MTVRYQLYKCEICGNVVQVLLEGADALVCCGEEMKLLETQHDTNEMGEKHNPKLEDRDGKRYVHVKSHPMLKEHYIQLIQTRTKDGRISKLQFFHPDEIPEMEVGELGDDIYAVEYCNIHELWGM